MPNDFIYTHTYVYMYVYIIWVNLCKVKKQEK